ncbi:hypothetical protein RMSM_05311 [Rhodopirellula maiorica SM1]|uniref:Uncharacterized protein n=1 Tax=Rhodopirellula maiorica SM1 TaxID=1265738 RepID=M5REJ7_9BACT|nr:hypothetical protein [Rhodopirellula maiorica]EMI17785.1 hypothetical protein RMSM_05311 [Rhodopirellula maiorica SM1]
MTARSIAATRGYLAIGIRDRGPIEHGLKKAYNEASKKAWAATAIYFHEHLRERRFTPEHAQAAGYHARKGEQLDRNSKAFHKSYYGRKLNSKFGGGRGVANPLMWTGDTFRKMKQASITSTSKRGRVAYRGGSKFSFRHPRSRIRMHDEFRRLLASEIQELARVYDTHLDRQWDQS